MNFEVFMARRQIQYEKECIRRMIEYLNNITQRLVGGFHTDSNKIRCLRNAVLGKKWSTTPLENISTGKYNFDNLVMALNEIIRLERGIHKASTSSKTYYGQFGTHLKDIRKYESAHRSNSRSH